MNEVVIIGAGPAGIAAAIQLKRYGLEPHLVERSAIGGLLRNANLVENYPGFPGGISGIELVRLLEKQVCDYQLRITYGEVILLDLSEGVFRVETSVREIFSPVVVIASGTKPKALDFPQIPEAARGRIFYEVYPLADRVGGKIMILGAGDAAFDYALNLARRNRVILLNRGSEPKCLPLLWQRARLIPAIEYHAAASVERIDAGSSGGLIVQYSCDGEIRACECEALIAAFGRDPQLDFLSSRLQGMAGELEAQGRLYFIGDVRNGIYRQTSIAVGDGVMAAMKIYEALRHERRGNEVFERATPSQIPPSTGRSIQDQLEKR